MRGMRFWMCVLLLAGVLNVTAFVPSASACPMCKAANETQSHLPRAYQYSILFMLAMPAMIFSGIGVGLYRMSKREAEIAKRMDDEQDGE
ncbi:MAG: hypothetical protein WEB58_07040 [Planctomycetaceae bacterium]